jgi:hypothetical protein
MKLEWVNPLTFPHWDELLRSTSGHSFFHTSNWARVLQESYRFKPSFLSLIRDEKFEVLIPLMEADSVLTGKRGVSLPFSDYCEPIVSERIERKEVIDLLIGHAEKAGWKYVEIRGAGDLFQDSIHGNDSYFRHTLNLLKDENAVYSNFKSNAKRNIKKAVKEGVFVQIDNSFSSLKEFYRLHCMTRREHGVPPQPFHFFRKIYDIIISNNDGFISLARYKDRVIAGAVFFHFGKNALYKYGASDKAYLHLRPNNLVMWEAIRWYGREGYESVCFGRTERENAGLRQFKNLWGTKETRIHYFRYDTAKKTFVFERTRGSESLTKRVLKRMPVPALRVIGEVFYRHMA